MARRKPNLDDPDGLLPKERAFVESYALMGDKAEAARAAGYSTKSAKQQGWALYERAEIRAAVGKRRTELAAEGHVDPKLVIAHLWIQATRKDDKATHAASVAALDKLARIAGLFVDRRELKVDTLTTTITAELGDPSTWTPEMRAALDRVAKLQREQSAVRVLEAAPRPEGGA